MKRVSVIGGGVWGAALARAAAHTGARVALFSKRTFEGALPEHVVQVKSFKEAASHARLLVLAVPSTVAHTVAHELGDYIDGSHYVVHGVRGLAEPELATVSEVVRKETAARRVGALGGPVLADELARNLPSVMVVGSRFPDLRNEVHEAFSSPTLRIYSIEDVTGLEWASALMGCLAIAIGYARGLDASPGLVAAFITRSVHEASRIAEAAGGDPNTLLGLAGFGDLLAAITQEERPEVLFGIALAKGASTEEALKAAKLRVEAATLIPKVAAWAEERSVRAPIFRALADGVAHTKDARTILHELMTGPN